MSRVTVRAGWCSAPGLGTGMFSCGVAWPGVRRGQALTGQSHPQGEKAVVEGGRKRQRCRKLGLVGLVGLPSCRSEAAGAGQGHVPACWVRCCMRPVRPCGGDCACPKRGRCCLLFHSKCYICAVCLNCNGSSPAMSEAHFFPPWCFLPLPIPCLPPPVTRPKPPGSWGPGSSAGSAAARCERKRPSRILVFIFQPVRIKERRHQEISYDDFSEIKDLLVLPSHGELIR